MTDFRQVQQQLTGWIRDPDAVNPPAGVEMRRLRIYRELFFNNMAGFVENGFPTLKKLLPDDIWSQLVEGFFATHHCQSPFFRDITQEFLKFLQPRGEIRDFPWILELAHFEWAEMAADVAEGEWPEAVAGDIWQQTPVLSPFVWPLVYAWPVHDMPKILPASPPLLPTALVLYRDRHHEVSYLITSLTGAALIEQCQREPLPLGTAVQRLAATHGLDERLTKNTLQPWVERFLAHEILLGVEAGS